MAVVAPTFGGMAIGRGLRRRLPEARFRQVVQCCLLVLGAYLAVRNLG